MYSTRKRKRCLSFLLALCMVVACMVPAEIASAENTHAQLWVDPVNGNDANVGTTDTAALKTIQTAAAKAAEMSANSDVVVYLKGGTYNTTETITFGEELSGKNGNTITYKSASGETAVISGGVNLEGWTLHDTAENIYVADIPEGAELIRQFYVDGEPQPNAATEQSPTDWALLSSDGYISPYVTSEDSNEYVILDLGAVKTISNVTLYAGSEADVNGKAAGFPKDFTISTSSDGTVWTTSVTETNFATPGIRNRVELIFTAVDARYVKLDVTKLGSPERLNRSKYNLSLSEIAVGLSEPGPAINLANVQHLNLDTNLLTAANTQLGYYCDGTTLSDFWADEDEEHGNTVANLVDGNYATYGSATGQVTAWLGSNTQAFLTTLDNAVSIGAIRLAVREDGLYLPTTFAVQVSVNGVAWDTVVYEAEYDWSQCDNENLFTFNPVPAKFVRILGYVTEKHPENDIYYLQFTEAAIYKPADLAVGATVDAPNNDIPSASWGKDYLANGIFDGLYTSGSTTTSTGLSAPITLNLGETNNIAGVRLYPRYGTNGPLQYIKAARFLVSNDGTNFEPVMELMNIATPTSGAQLFVFPETVNAQYVRIEPLEIDMGAGETSYRFQLYEIEVAPAKAEQQSEAGEPVYKTEIINTKIDLTADDLLVYGNLNRSDLTTVSHPENGNWPGTNAIDGDVDTYATVSQGLYISWVGSYVPCISVDVSENDAATKVSQIELYVQEDYRSAPVTFDIQVADANDNWTTVKTVTNHDWTTSQNATFSFEPVNAYKLRLLAYAWHPERTDYNYPECGTDSNSAGYFRICELMVYKAEERLATSEVALTADDLLVFGNVSATDLTTVNHGANTNQPGTNAIDGDVNTFASVSQGLYISWVSSYVPCISVDVSENGAATKVSQIELYVQEDYRSAPVTFDIQVADANDNWTTVKTVTNHDWTASQNATFSFEPVNAYKLRLLAYAWHPERSDYNYPECGTDSNSVGYFRIYELKVYAVEQLTDSTNPIPAGLITQGEEATSGTSYDVVDITVKNDNTDSEHNANKAIDGYIEPHSNHGWLVPESWNFEEIGNVTDVEVHFLNLWYHSFVHVDTVSGDGTEVIAYTGGRRPAWLANAYEFINCVGEWYIDRTAGKIYYKAEGTMDDKEAVLPVVEQVIYMEDASNIVFDGIVFEHTSYTLPSEINYNDAQANTISANGWIQVDGGIMLDSCENIGFTNCEIRNMGTAGIKLRNNTDGVSITNSLFHDISYSGIIVGEVYKHHGYEKFQLVTNTTIQNNYITRVGLDMFDSPAIVATYTNGTVIDHNEIAYCPYTGISTGWGWSQDNEDAIADVGNNKVTNNLVHDTSKTNRDGGSIYNLGPSAGTIISGNYVYNSWDGDKTLEVGIYLDEGSANIEVGNNVIGGNVKYWMQEAGATIHDNYWHDNFYHADVDMVAKGTNTKVENNTAVANGNFDAYSNATEIISNAGLLDENVKEGITIGFAPEHRIVQEMYPAINSRYIRNDWGWGDIMVEGQISKTLMDYIDYEVTIVMPADTDLSALALTFDLDEGWTCDKTSGLVQDFTNPVTYTLTNGELTVTWSVIVKREVVAGDEIEGTDVTMDEIIENYDAEDWTVAALRTTEDGLVFKGYSGYIGERFDTDTILQFDMTSGLTSGGKDWLQISLRNQDPYTMCVNGGTEYNIGFNYDNIEIQKFVEGERTVLYGVIEGFEAAFGSLPNDFYDANVRHSIKVGAINVDEGVRLFLFVDGNKVFDIIDSDNPIMDDGFFALYGMTQEITLSKFTDIQKVEQSGVDVNIDLGNSNAEVIAPVNGWVEGTNTFSVSSGDGEDTAFIVAVKNEDGTYSRVTATATDTEGVYSYTVEDVTAETEIVVALSGDTNGDGKVSNADITRLRAAYAGKLELDGLQSLVADVNGSGTITNADITRLRAAYAGKTKLDW